MNPKESKDKKRIYFRKIRSSQTSSSLEKKIYKEVEKVVIEFQKEQHSKGYLGIYWPLPGEIDLMQLKIISNLKVALPACMGRNYLNYHPLGTTPLIKDDAGIPAPLKERILRPEELGLLLVPALSVDKYGIRLGYGGGYFDFLRSNPYWKSIPAYIVIMDSCISAEPLPSEEWDIPFNGWISEKGRKTISPIC